MTQALEYRLNYHPSIHEKTGFNRLSARKVRRRLQLITTQVDFKDKTVLDLGCSGGFFSFSLAKIAKHVVAIDGDKEIIERNILFLNQEKEVFKNLEFRCATINPDLIQSLPNFDIVLFLSVFHHMLACSDAYGWNTESSRKDAFTTLAMIRDRANILIFELGGTEEGYDWSSKLPPMHPTSREWITKNIFDERFDVQVIPSPMFSGIFGNIRAWITKHSRKKQLFWRILRKVFKLDPRDARDIFIGVKRI